MRGNSASPLDKLTLYSRKITVKFLCSKHRLAAFFVYDYFRFISPPFAEMFVNCAALCAGGELLSIRGQGRASKSNTSRAEWKHAIACCSHHAGSAAFGRCTKQRIRYASVLFRVIYIYAHRVKIQEWQMQSKLVSI